MIGRSICTDTTTTTTTDAVWVCRMQMGANDFMATRTCTSTRDNTDSGWVSHLFWEREHFTLSSALTIGSVFLYHLSFSNWQPGFLIPHCVSSPSKHPACPACMYLILGNKWKDSNEHNTYDYTNLECNTHCRNQR